MTTHPRTTSVVVLAVSLTLSGCGGGGPARLSESEIAELRSDPRVVRADRIAARADTLRVPSMHASYRITAGGVTDAETLVENFTCVGATCLGQAGGVLTLDDFSDEGSYLTEATLGSQGGFDTVTLRGGFDTDLVSGEDLVVTAFPSSVEYGLWGQYGYATAVIFKGPFSGTVEGTGFSGNVNVAVAAAYGDSTGANPTGIGGATWRGVAEAVSPRTFERFDGTAVLSVPDLSNPRVNASIRIAGDAIGSPAWDSIPLDRGSFRTGRHGHDFLSGDFYGPAHQESYGVFDTGAYLGVFGAKR